VNADRAAGAVLLALGGLLIFAVIPAQVEAVQYGWLRPRTMPYLMAGIIALCGAALLLRPGDEAPRRIAWARAALFTALLVAGLAAIRWAGFIWVAPVMAAALMLAAGERRPVWLAAGTVGTPLAIWLCVAVLLERALP
jgi:putative tricarboxylic transport membrane protein